MEFSLVDGKRMKPLPRIHGECPMCGQETISKCGPKNTWHWAHKGRKHCDPWWENETEWHRLWKSYFPETMREVVHFDDDSGEKHIADLKTNNDLVIEIQHSSMSSEELHSRESFYKKMIWVVDAKPFAKQFKILPDKIPHPKSKLHEDIFFLAQTSRSFARRSEFIAGSNMVEVHWCNEIENEIENDYMGHHFFIWKRPRGVWFESKAPVFFDFGGDELLKLLPYPREESIKLQPNTFPWLCVRKIPKKLLIEKNGGTYTN